MTPCEERGYKVGDRFRVIGGVDFVPESIVELYKDDDTIMPKFKLLSGRCNSNLCAEQPSAYTHIDDVEKIEMTETKQQKLERIERIEEELEALKRDVSKPEQWEPGVAVHVSINGPYPAIYKVTRAALVAAKVAKYVYDHAPDWDGSNPWGIYERNGSRRVCRASNTLRTDLCALTGPRCVMEKLAADLDSGRVVL